MSPALECLRKVYRVGSGPCFDILTIWQENRRLVSKQCWDWVESKGGVAFIPGAEDNVGNATAITRVIFEGELPAGWLRRSINLASPLKPGQVTAVPDRRTNIGKALMKEIKALPLRPSTCGPCDEIGFPHSLKATTSDSSFHTSLGLFTTMQVGWIAGGTFYVSLPDEKRKRLELEEKGYTVEGEPWEPLPGMVEILKEEMDLDFARAKLAQAGAA
jgi:hypothetical protein